MLLPTDTSKFLAQWKGPYPVVKSVSNVLYEVDMIGNPKTTPHIPHQHAEEVECHCCVLKRTMLVRRAWTVARFD